MKALAHATRVASWKTQVQRIAVLLSALFFAFFLTSINVHAQGQQDSSRLPLYDSTANYMYSAKIICGTQRKSGNLRLAKGIYGTAINVHNPNNGSNYFLKKLALAFPPGGQKEGKIYPIAYDKLGIDGALEVDCEDVIRRVFPNGIPSPGYFTGFIVLEAQEPLDVTGVYTVSKFLRSPSRAEVVSIDVEQIKERKMKTGCPDLIPVPKNCQNPRDPKCYCYRRGNNIRVAVRNQGTEAATGAFDVTVDFGTHGSQTRRAPSGTMNPGDEILLTFTIPSGCFDSDCEFVIKVDARDEIKECDENNNVVKGLCQG